MAVQTVAPQYIQLSEGFVAEQKAKLAKIDSDLSWMIKVGAAVALTAIAPRLFKEAGVELITSDTASRLTFSVLSVTALMTSLGLFVKKFQKMQTKAVSPEQKKTVSIFSSIVAASITVSASFLSAFFLSQRGIEIIPSSLMNQLNPYYVVALSWIPAALASVFLPKMHKPEWMIANTYSKEQIETTLNEIRALLKDARPLQDAEGAQACQAQFEERAANREATGDAQTKNIYGLFREVRNANQLTCCAVQTTPLINELEKLERQLEAQLSSPVKVLVITDSKTSAVEDRIYIDPETKALGDKLIEEFKVAEGAKNKRIAEVKDVIIRLFSEADSIDKISQELKIPTAKLEAWKQVADRRIGLLAKYQGEQLDKWKLQNELISIANDIVEDIQNDNNRG